MLKQKLLSTAALAKKLGVNVSTLGCRLREMKEEGRAPKIRQSVEEGRVYNLFDALAVESVRRYIKERPIGRVGRPVLPKQKGKP